MDSEGKKFGRGPKELTGAVDLITHYKLLPHHEFFCKKSLSVSIADTHYLHNVVGDAEIKKGDGMQLDQLIQNPSYSLDGSTRIRSLDLDALREAFHLRETTPFELPYEEERVPTVVGKSGEKDRKHKRHKDGDKEKDKERKKHKHRHKDRSKDKDKKRDKSRHQDAGVEHSKKHHDKKRKHDGDKNVNNIRRHKKEQA